ncbi:hypothetical protein SAMN05880574_10941 [Chryseobacterium sp. RU37D]|uniref:hypothetical protein n=1 Tax=Chryseobacterium sp. RU37D TaxID=1907397 RepID=UPI0009565959|nr:hypothetical protein [Chryseobacterium sp. RU37D]SIQ27326.1 hypothetical protein SAMN05880574_10941 [Chryseobacterium sp. RU37D]
MSNQKWGVFTLLFSISVSPQQIDWDKINSNTIMNVISVGNPDPTVSYSNIMQIGNNNYTGLSINANTDIAIKQAGDYNTLLYINSFNHEETKTVISEQGNNNIIDITGSNSISDGMQIHVKGDNKTIFIRNY